jgi:hypothetical protein
MQSNLAALKVDDTTALGLRLMRSFLKLRSLRHREEVIALAEQLANEEARYQAEAGD